jgi:hypothetical protein
MVFLAPAMIRPCNAATEIKEVAMASTVVSRGLFASVASMATLIAISDVAAHATPIQYGYAGVSTSADPSTGAVTGTPFSGTFSYDPAKLSNWITIEGSFQAIYGRSASFPDSVADGSNLTLQVGGKPILINPGGVQISLSQIQYPGEFGYRDANGNPANPYTKLNISNGNIDGGPIQVSLELTNLTRSLFGSLATPSAITLSDFTDAQLNVTELTNPGSKSLYTGTINSLVEMPVPEPTLMSMLGLVAVGWFARSRRRQERGLSRIALRSY